MADVHQSPGHALANTAVRPEPLTQRLSRLIDQIRAFQQDIDRLIHRPDTIPFVWRE